MYLPVLLTSIRQYAIFYITACLSLAGTGAISQTRTDTLRISLPEAEKRFLDSNLQLLASHYNVDAQKALIQQARLWDNPVLNTDQVIAANGRFLPYGKNADGSYSGQYYLQVQQLIKTAGKRAKQVNLATTNAALSELQLQDLLRNLRYQLRTGFHTLVQQLGTRAIYEGQLQQLNKLVTGMAAQLLAGNIAQKDHLRMQALVIALEQDLAELDRNIADNQADLKTLLQLRTDVFLKPAGDDHHNETIALPGTEQIFAAAKINNASYLLQQTQNVWQQQNLVYQRALRAPDITIGPNFDRNSSFAPNYVGLGISLPLPLLNKNQGNIRSAENSVRQQRTVTANTEIELWNNIQAAWQKWTLLTRQDNEARKAFYARYRDMYGNILKSYQQRQIGLLEFLDFFNDFTATQHKLLQERLNLRLAVEELNYHAGIDIIR